MLVALIIVGKILISLWWTGRFWISQKFLAVSLLYFITMYELELAIVCYSVVSCLFSLSVICTIVFFPGMKSGNLMPIILYMSLSDLLMNVASCFGFPDGGTALCWAQGMAQNYFALTSWFWTTMLAYRVYCTVRYGMCELTKRKMHIFCWGFPLLLILLPLTTNNYGASDTELQWCTLVQRRPHPKWLIYFWSYMTYFGWLLVCIVLMISWNVVIFYKFRNNSMKNIVLRTYDKVYLYPIAMSVCWILNYWCDDLYGVKNRTLNPLSMIFGISNGILAACIFMFKSEEARKRWKGYLYPPKKNSFDGAVEPQIRLDFENDDYDGATTDFLTGDRQSDFQSEYQSDYQSERGDRGSRVDSRTESRDTDGNAPTLHAEMTELGEKNSISSPFHAADVVHDVEL